MEGRTVYIFSGNGEIIIGTNRDELVEMYFLKGNRNLEDYNEDVAEQGYAIITQETYITI